MYCVTSSTTPHSRCDKHTGNAKDTGRVRGWNSSLRIFYRGCRSCCSLVRVRNYRVYPHCTTPHQRMSSLMGRVCCLFTFVWPTLCFRPTAFSTLARSRTYRPTTNVQRASVGSGSRADYVVGGCAAAIIAVTTTPSSSSATTPTTVVRVLGLQSLSSNLVFLPLVLPLAHHTIQTDRQTQQSVVCWKHPFCARKTSALICWNLSRPQLRR